MSTTATTEAANLTPGDRVDAKHGIGTVAQVWVTPACEIRVIYNDTHIIDWFKRDEMVKVIR
jgi:hypothetical protein